MRFALAIVLPLSLGAAAAGQSPVADVAEPVEQAIGDVSPLSLSIRRVQPGLAQGANFDQVFRYGDGYLRVQGGLYAVFDNSVYARDSKRQGRLNAVVPPGTMYYIGPPPEPPEVEPAQPSPDRVDGRVDLKLESRVATGLTPALMDARAPEREPPAAPPGPVPDAAAYDGPPAEPGAIIANPEYRALRVRMMMRRAAQEHRAAVAAATQAAVGRSSFSSSK